MINRGIEVIETGFSVNIENDFKINEKINAYIPTEKNIKLLAKISEGIINKEKGAYLLSGAYGSGKSFFISVLLNLFAIRSKNEIKIFLERAEKYFPLSETFNKLNDNKYLIVFARDRFSSFEKTILHGILDTIKNENLKIDLNVESEIILKKIKEWEKNNSSIIEKFIIELEKNGENLKILKIELQNNKVLAIKKFKDIYKKVFYGESFINYETHLDIKKLLLNFEEEVLKRTEYKGIIYVFDEFGRYLESNINKIDVKEVQDMAEYCNSNNSSFMFLITHKDIFQYTNKLNRQDNILEWEKVTGRFAKEQLLYDKVTALTILSHSIYKTESFKNFKKDNLDLFEKYKKNLLESKLINKSGDEIIDEFYPLNYLSAYILPELSQKIAQNERTMFAFLNSIDKTELYRILEEDFFIGLDKIYDYFEENFKFLNHESQEYRSYYNTKNSLNMTKVVEEIKVLKTLGLIEIYNKYLEIPPTIDILKLALNYSYEELEEILKELQKKNLILYKRNKKHFKILEDEELNIEIEVKKYIEEKMESVNYTKLLNKFLKLDFYYPVKYNYKKDITRFLKQSYIVGDGIDYSTEEEICDGEILYLVNLPTFQNYDEMRKVFEKKGLLITNNEQKKLKIEYFLKELEAIEHLILDERYFKNSNIKEECLLYKEEIINIINSELTEYFSEENREVWYKGEKLQEKKLLNITFDYLEEKYPKYIEINYELMNKTKLSFQMKKVRQNLLEMLLNNAKELNREEFYENTGAINSVARTVLRKIVDVSNGEIIFLDKWKNLEEEVISKLKEENRYLKQIYDSFTTDKEGYGLRNGIFTLFLGILLIKNKGSIEVIDNNSKLKQNLTSELVEKIEKNPEGYYLAYVEKTAEEEKYLLDLKDLLGLYFSENLDIEIGILEGIKNYFYSLNRYITSTILKESKVLSKIFNILFQDRNAHEFLFKELLVRARTENFQEVVQILKTEMKKIEEEKLKFEIAIKKITIEALGSEESLEEAIKDWKDRTNILDNGIKLWLKKYNYQNERSFIKEITTKIKGFSYENWSTFDDVDDYKEKLTKFLKPSIEKIQSKEDIGEIIIGEEKILVPILKEHTQLGKMLKIKLQSTIKAMGLSLKEEEKKSILLEILKEL